MVHTTSALIVTCLEQWIEVLVRKPACSHRCGVMPCLFGAGSDAAQPQAKAPTAGGLALMILAGPDCRQSSIQWRSRRELLLVVVASCCRQLTRHSGGSGSINCTYRNAIETALSCTLLAVQCPLISKSVG
jgi:hypothetical protein